MKKFHDEQKITCEKCDAEFYFMKGKELKNNKQLDFERHKCRYENNKNYNNNINDLNRGNF